MVEFGLEGNKDYFETFDDVHVVVLYGSHAAGKATTRSDVDVAVYFETPLTAAQKMDIVSGLGDRCQVEIDVLDLHQASAMEKKKTFGLKKSSHIDGRCA